MSRNLVIVRAGDASLHPGWLAGGGGRSWDIIVNYYGDNPDIFRDGGQRRIDSKGPKWPALHQLVGEHLQELLAYDYIWMPDDDLVATGADIDRLFAVMSEFGLRLAQPSLTLDSIVGHIITMSNKSFRLRYTNFVEIMAPCFNRDFFERCWPSFNTNISGWGLDFLWPTWAEKKEEVAVIDEVAVRHTRMRGAQYGFLKEGPSPERELAELVLKHRLRNMQMTVGGVDKNNQLDAVWNGGQKRLIEKLIAGYLPELGNYPQHIFKAIEPLVGPLKINEFCS